MLSYSAALITGASSGIGAAFAAALPATTHLLLHGRDRMRLAAIAGPLQRSGRRVEVVAADLADADGRRRVIDRAEAFGIDLLINNAGFGRGGNVLDNPAADEADMVLVNALAPVVLTRALLPGMLAKAEAEGRRAGIVVVASVASFLPCPGFATYAATKAFDLAYAEALAVELRHRPADVLALCPGTTDTGFFRRAGLAPGGRAMAPERVAREALDRLGRRSVHVAGATNRLVPLAARLVPRAWLARAAAAGMGRRRPPVLP